MAYSYKVKDILGAKSPIIAAPMAGASGGALAAAVTLGGGFGFMAAGYSTPDKFKAELSIARSKLGVDLPAQLPIGVGFLCWRLELSNSPELELLYFSLESNVKAIWFAFGNDIGRWVDLVREHDRKAGKPTKTVIFVQVSSVEEALKAVHDWKVDIIVAQGIESGGHGHSGAPPLLSLIPAILSVLPNGSPPLIAAGGLSQGAHVASVLTLGASGAVLGTRFLLTPESLYSDRHKLTLIDASATTRTMAFDLVRGTLGWPNGVDGRGLPNKTVEEFEKGVTLDELKRRYSPDDPDRMVVWAGTGVASMSVIKSALEVVRELHQDCLEHLKRALSLIEADQ